MCYRYYEMPLSVDPEAERVEWVAVPERTPPWGAPVLAWWPLRDLLAIVTYEPSKKEINGTAPWRSGPAAVPLWAVGWCDTEPEPDGDPLVVDYGVPSYWLSRPQDVTPPYPCPPMAVPLVAAEERVRLGC